MSGREQRLAGAQTGATNPSLSRASRPVLDVSTLIAGLKAFDPSVLGQAISLVESTRSSDRPRALALLNQCQALASPTIRLGVSGAPGTGKSTLIDSLGMLLVDSGLRVAVLAVDPTSARTGGSILGDKTRMPRLTAHPSSFIRPSPAGGVLGGVSRYTRAAISVCEAAGCDVVIVETVGVGQSETAVREMVDFFLLLSLAGAGDELQGIKRGIIEVADAIAVTKADGDNVDPARNAASSLRAVLSLFPLDDSGWRPEALHCSAIDGTGVDSIWQAVLRYREATEKNSYWGRNRTNQRLVWFESEVLARQAERLSKTASEKREALIDRVRKGSVHPYAAAEEFVSGQD